MLAKEQISKLKVKLSKADPGSISEVIDIFEQLQKFEITVEILKETGIGVVVGKLRKNPNEEVAKVAKQLVEKWKSLVPVPAKEPTTPSKRKNDENILSPKLSSPQTPVKAARTDTSAQPTAGSGDIRDKVLESFAQALRDQPLEDGDGDPQIVSKEIELEMFNSLDGVSKDYKTKYRSIHFNLKDPKNQYLRRQVISGMIGAKQLVNMNPMELASPEIKQQRKKFEEYHLEAAKVDRMEATTDQFRCGKCKERKTTYRQLQTRSADEPMTTYVTCLSCNHHWKFC